jgi:hypothetical protein
MRRRSLFLSAGIVVLLLGGAGAGLIALVRQEPSFYHDKAVPPGPQRVRDSGTFQQVFVALHEAIRNDQSTWQARFTEVQINSYFEEDFLRSGVAKSMLPDDISAPRVSLEEDTIRVAFRYGAPPWSTIISIDFRVWLAPKDMNVVALELQGVHAGSLPFSAQSLLERVSDIARRQNIEVTWYRHNGNPVALLHFPSAGARPKGQLQHLQVRDGALFLAGRSLDRTPRLPPGSTVSLPPPTN